MLLLTVALTISLGVVRPNPAAASSPRKCGRVHITVSSLRNAYLELNWITTCDSSDVQPGVVSLFDKDPTSREELRPLDSIHASNYPSGFYKTRVKFKDPYMPGNWEYHENLTRADPGRHCFPYWVASFAEDGSLIDSQCFGIQPTWMEDHREILLQRKVDGILIPGTHNSGAFDGSTLPKLVQNYVLNQDKLIWTQLVFGIRYLDLRVGYYKLGGFYINHDLVRITPLKPVLKQIRKFLEMTEEVLILDFHRFPYPTQFGADLHKKLVDLLFEELGEFAAPRGNYARSGVSFKQLWEDKKRLIISYSDDATIRDKPWLWRGISQYWADTVSTATLKSYMLSKINTHSVGSNPFWALMAELTPQFSDILFLTNNLRKLADDVNRELTKWFRDEWAQLSVNIVATDFFLGNDLINVAIEEITSR